MGEMKWYAAPLFVALAIVVVTLVFIFWVL